MGNSKKVRDWIYFRAFTVNAQIKIKNTNLNFKENPEYHWKFRVFIQYRIVKIDCQLQNNSLNKIAQNIIIISLTKDS